MAEDENRESDSSKVSYIQGRNDGKKESKEIIAKLTKEVISLKKIINCKHLRAGSIRAEDGYMKTCLTCGHQWFKTDKPLTAIEKLDKANFEREVAAGRI